MMPFIEVPAFVQGMIGLCIVLLLFATVMNAVLEMYHRHFKYVYSLAAIAVVLYGSFQVICDICSHMNTQIDFLNRMEDRFGQIPVWVFAAAIPGITAIELLIFSKNQKWGKENITPVSIKEAIDDLPEGICCYEPSGQIMMKNNRMEDICRAYTGEPLLNAVSFRQAVYADENSGDENSMENETILVLNEDKVFSISDKPFSEEEPMLRVMTAADITEQYRNTQRLRAQQELVVKLNEELSEYGKQIVSSITAREVLNAKVKLHDELGANLLAIKRYILNGGTTEERIAIENILRKNLQYLKNETVVKEMDEYAVILDTAAKLDMKITVHGELTETEPQRHVIVTGIHECLTNTIRHAGGDELTVTLEEETESLIARFTNNGKAPEKEIKARGGLALLRALTEECGGTMQILSEPDFELILKLPKERTNYVI